MLKMLWVNTLPRIVKLLTTSFAASVRFCTVTVQPGTLMEPMSAQPTVPTRDPGAHQPAGGVERVQGDSIALLPLLPLLPLLLDAESCVSKTHYCAMQGMRDSDKQHMARLRTVCHDKP